MLLLGQVDILSDLQARLTFHKMYPCGRDILWPSVTTSDQVYFLSDLLVRLTFHQMCPLAETSCSQVLLLQSGWPLVRCTPGQRHRVVRCVTTSVRLTFGQMYSPGQRHFVAKCVTTSVRLTFGQMYPQQRHHVTKCVTTLEKDDMCIRGQVWC